MTGSGLAAYLALSLLTGVLPRPPVLTQDLVRHASHAVWTTQQQALASRSAGRLATAAALFEREALLYWLLAHQPSAGARSPTLLLDTAAALTDAAGALRSLGQYRQAAVLYQEASPLWASTRHPQTSTFASLSGQELGTRLGVYALQPRAVTLPGGKFVPPPGKMYLGAYTELDSRVDGNHFRRFDALMHRHFAAFLEYVPWGDPFPFQFVRDCVRAGAAVQIAWEPSQGLAAVGPTPYVVGFLRSAAAARIPIFLRFAGEMNGPWVPWHGHPRAFVAAWRRLWGLVHRFAPNVALVWAPDATDRVGALAYYPGNAYVDWVGVSDYLPYASRAGHHTVTSAGATLLAQLRWLYRAFARVKPIMIAEGGVAHASSLVTGRLDRFARRQYAELLADIPLFDPDVRAVFFFDVNTVRHPNPGFASDLATSDFSLTDSSAFLGAIVRLLHGQRSHFAFPVSAGDVPSASGTALVPVAVTGGSTLTATGPLLFVARAHAYGAGPVSVRYRVGSRSQTALSAPYAASFSLPRGTRPVRATATLRVDGRAAVRIRFRVEPARPR